MKIGVLKEMTSERRVAMLPESIADILKKNEVTFLVEKGAGGDAYISDEAYKESGAEMVSREEVFSNSDIIVGVMDPAEEELDKMSDGQVLMSVFNPLTNKSFIDKLKSNKITSFSLDNIPRTTRAQSMDVLSSQATAAGYKAVLEAANHLPEFFPMFMTAAGTIKPAKVLVLGAGVAGLQAIATARRLGAVVSAFDVRSAVKEEVQSLGAKFVEVEGAKDDKDAGGYAVEQSEEFKQRQMKMIQEHAAKSNVIIATAQIPGKKAPVLVKKETLDSMKAGSVIVDLAASSGGNCEATENDEITEVDGVKIIGQSNYPSTIPVSSSHMYGKNVVNFLKLLIDNENKLVIDFEDDIISGTCVTHQGEMISERIKKAYENLK